LRSLISTSPFGLESREDNRVLFSGVMYTFSILYNIFQSYHKRTVMFVLNALYFERHAILSGFKGLLNGCVCVCVCVCVRACVRACVRVSWLLAFFRAEWTVIGVDEVSLTCHV